MAAPDSDADAAIRRAVAGCRTNERGGRSSTSGWGHGGGALRSQPERPPSSVRHARQTIACRSGSTEATCRDGVLVVYAVAAFLALAIGVLVATTIGR